MNIHVKIWDVNAPNPMIEEIVALVRKHDCARHAYFMTTNDEILKKVMEYAPDVAVCVGWDGNHDPMSMPNRAIQLGAKKIQLFKPYFNAETVKFAHENGIRCNVFWSDDPTETQEFLDMGIDTILANDYLSIANTVKNWKEKR
jgi:glycerophosphoryl diester phosphodiesterase